MRGHISKPHEGNPTGPIKHSASSKTGAPESTKGRWCGLSDWQSKFSSVFSDMHAKYQ